MRFILALLAVLIITLAATTGYTAMLQDNWERHNVTNESWTADPGNVTYLNNSSLDGANYTDVSNVTVRDENDTEMEQPRDFEWIRHNGTIVANDSDNSRLEQDETANITYHFHRPPPEQVWQAAIVGTYGTVAGLLVFLIPLLLLIKIMGGV